MNKLISFFRAVRAHDQPSENFEVWLEACTSWDGHEREAALRRLDQLSPKDLPQALPWVLRRLNDWVPQVRDQALLGLSKLMLEGLEPAWAAALPELERFSRAQRQAPEPILRRFDGYWFDRAEGHNALANAQSQWSAHTRRWLALREARYLMRIGRSEALTAWLEQALQSADPLLSAHAVEQLRDAELPLHTLQRLRELALDSRHARVALSAARQLHAQGNLPPTSWATLGRRASGAVLDWLAYFADTATRQLLVENAQAQWATCASARQRASALGLLLRLSPDLAAPCLPIALIDPDARLRLLALQAGTPAGREADVLIALRDPSSTVRRWGARCVLHGALPPDDAELRAVLIHQPEALPQVLNLLLAAGPWRRAAWFWALAAESERPLAYWLPLLQRLERSLECSFTEPSAEQLQRIHLSRQVVLTRWPELAPWGRTLTELQQSEAL